MRVIYRRTSLNGINGLERLGYTTGWWDGLLCTIEKPKDVPNPLEFFSGYYQKFDFNVQAVCDANLYFIHLAVAGKGQSNDARAFRKMTVLWQWIESLKDRGYFIIGDNAYPIMNTLLIPFSGVEAGDPWKDAYNFYLSQLRIRIEMCFGRLTIKWRIFRTDLCANNGSKKKYKDNSCWGKTSQLRD